MYRPIKGTNGRYLINENGKVIDTQPAYMEHMEWNWSFDPTQPRAIIITDDKFNVVKSDGKTTVKYLYNVIKETFPELFQIDEESRQRIINSYQNEAQRTYSISVNDFNRLIYPNELIKLYDTTNNGKRYKNGRPILPSVINIPKSGSIMLHKGRRYFGIGTRNVIHFDKNGLPYNAKPWAEPDIQKYRDLSDDDDFI